ncbi:EAL domain-containing protein (putative c-di-GMP-specific phosphodiesterase class I) [Nitrobacteraceae bacterium AZCC 2146]
MLDVSGSSSIVQAVVNIASARNMTTVAEGVDTPQQLDVLHAVGCTEIRGSLCGAPMPAADIRRLFSLPPARKVAAS